MLSRLALAVLSLAVLDANEPVREVTSEAVLVGNQLVPACRGGYVYWIGCVYFRTTANYV